MVMSAPHCRRTAATPNTNWHNSLGKGRIDAHVLANQLQEEGAKSFVKTRNHLMSVIDSKSALFKRGS